MMTVTNLGVIAMPETLMWAIGGACTLGLLLLSGIWSELRLMTAKLEALGIKHAEQGVKLSAVELRIDRLPCVRDNKCAGM